MNNEQLFLKLTLKAEYSNLLSIICKKYQIEQYLIDIRIEKTTFICSYSFTNYLHKHIRAGNFICI